MRKFEYIWDERTLDVVEVHEQHIELYFIIDGIEQTRRLQGKKNPELTIAILLDSGYKEV